MTGFPHRLLFYDRRLSQAIAARNERTLFRLIVLLMSISGQAVIWLALGVGLTWRGIALGLQLLVAVGAALVVTQLLKALFRRPRPAERRVTIATNKYAFPSGHALRVGAVASTVALNYPPLALICAVWAVLVSLARVARTAHYFSDVLVGLILGVVVGGCLRFLPFT